MKAKPTRVYASTWRKSGAKSARRVVPKKVEKPIRNTGDLKRPRRSFMDALSLAFRLRGADARIEEADEDIDAEVRDEHAHRDEERAAGDDRIIRALNGGEDGHAQSRIRENHLRDERAADHPSERQREAGELREHGVAEH